MTDKLVFVTVGTTKFDLLVSTITQVDVLNTLRSKGYKNIIIQIGSGSVIPKKENAEQADIILSYYRYKNSLHEDILKADLIISHAGAGSCLEVLGEQKPLLVVVNEELMHNHQTELADQLSSEGYLFACNCVNLKNTIQKMDLKELKKMVPAQSKLFANYLDKFMGFQD